MFLPSLLVLSILLGYQVVIVYITQICLLKCAHRSLSSVFFFLCYKYAQIVNKKFV